MLMRCCTGNRTASWIHKVLLYKRLQQLYMVQSAGMHMCAPAVYLYWHRANTRHTPHYTKLHKQESANTIHHHGRGTLVLYTPCVRPQHLTPGCSLGEAFGTFQKKKKKKKLWQLDASCPTGSHWVELLEWQRSHTVPSSNWAKWLLFFFQESLSSHSL